jgi:hypothetical protein
MGSRFHDLFTAAMKSLKGKRPISPEAVPHQQKKSRAEAPTIPSITEQRAIHICSRVRDFAAKMVEHLKKAHVHDSTTPPSTQFGDVTQQLPKRKYISGRSFASNPWMRGFAPPMPASSSAAEMLESYIMHMHTEELQRFNIFTPPPPPIFFWVSHCAHFFDVFLFLHKIFAYTTTYIYSLYFSSTSVWFDHPEPRLVRVDGITVRKQLVGGHGLEHELGTVLIRRFAQMDRESNTECPYINYKHVLELDFSVSSVPWLSLLLVSPQPPGPLPAIRCDIMVKMKVL